MNETKVRVNGKYVGNAENYKKATLLAIAQKHGTTKVYADITYKGRPANVWVGYYGEGSYVITDETGLAVFTGEQGENVIY